MSTWFIGRSFLEEEKRRLSDLAAQRGSNARQIRREQSQLQAEVARELGGVKGLSLSFGVGCAAALAYRNREKLGLLRDLPWAEVAQIVQEIALSEQSPEGVTQRGPRQASI